MWLWVPCFDQEGKAGLWVTPVPALFRHRRTQSRAPGVVGVWKTPSVFGCAESTSPASAGKERV